jgi:phage replication O-like protein O
MANPQPKPFTKVSNELLDELAKIRIPGEAMQILFVIIRETDGWNRKEAMIQNKTFAEKTGIVKQNINRAISKLKELNLIKVIKNDYSIAPTYCFNKDCDTWKKVIKNDYSNQKRLHKVSKVITSTMLQPFGDNGSGDPKESIKESISTYKIFFEEFWENYPKRRGVRQGKKDCKDFIVTKKKIKPEDFEKVLLAEKNYAEAAGDFPKDPIRFLKHEIWKDHLEPPKRNPKEIII